MFTARYGLGVYVLSKLNPILRFFHESRRLFGGLSSRMSVFDSRSLFVSSVVTKVAQRQVFSKYFSYSLHKCSRTISVCMFFLPERQKGGTWETPKNFALSEIEEH